MREKIAERLMQHYAEGAPWDGFMEADIVLDVLLEPTLGVQNAGWTAALRQGIDPEGIEITPVFTAMIRAAKEGK